MRNLLIEYPSWALVLCLMLGAVYALILYYRDKRLYDLSQSTRYVLSFIRFLAVSFISFFLLEPLIKQLETELDEPVVVLAVDNSRSLLLNKDSAQSVSNIATLSGAARSVLSEKFEIVNYTFGQEVKRQESPDFTEPVTDISALFQSLKDRYSNRNLAAVVLATDGIYNRGSNPRYALGGLNVPVYPMALGDTTIRKDALVAEIAANRLAFLGNSFPIEALVRADKYKGSSLNFSLIKNGEILESRTLDIDKDQFEQRVRFLVDANQVGLQAYRVSISPLEGEITRSNNIASVIVDVIDSRQKVLILGTSPHPDIFALRRAIESSENYEVEVTYQKDLNTGNLADYDILVLHQIPSQGTTPQIQAAINGLDKPIFAIAGGQTVIKRMPAMGLGVQLSAPKGSFNDVSGVLNPSFSKFVLADDLNGFVNQAPPLQVPFGEWNIANSAEVILNQRVGNINTEDPLLLVNEVNEEKNAILLGEGIWRWRLYDYAVNENHKQFDGLITSLIQFLAVKEDKRFFRVSGPRDLMENESIIFNAELYNAAYEAVNDAEASLEVRDADGNTYPFNFSRTERAYRLDAGTLPVGTYTYRARSERGGATYTDAGSFSVQPFELEGANLRADHRLLFNIAENSGGELFYPSNMDETLNRINNSDRAVPISYSTEILSSFLNLGWPLLLIILLLSTEWFIRKRTGHY